MPIDTRFGSFPARVEDVVTMTDGLPGFENCHRFVVVTAEALAPLTCLQGLEGARPSFLALDPRLVISDYAAMLPASDRRRLDVHEADPLLWLALVQIGEDGGRINLRAPVVIDPRRMIGLQVIDADNPYATDHPLFLD